MNRILDIARSIAKENMHEAYGAPHLLRACLHKDFEALEFLKDLDFDTNYLMDWANIRIAQYPKGRPSVQPKGDLQVPSILEEADVISIKSAIGETSALSILAAIIKPNIAFTSNQLKSLPINHEDLVFAITKNVDLKEAKSSDKAGSSGNSGVKGNRNTKVVALNQYCIDKSSLAIEGKIDPIVGRDKELRQLIEILGRRSKPNAIIVGEPGVGKTALVDGFALAIAQGQVPESFKSARLFELDLGALAAGASYKGETEDRLKSILKEIKSFEKAILFIDEIHVLLDANGPLGSGLANLLKPELARGEVTVVGATTLDEYRKYIEKEEAFNRRFETVAVEEPDKDVAYRMLLKILPIYSDHHNLDVDNEAIKSSIDLAKRYSKERRLPDSAIDLVDRTMSSIKLIDETSEGDIKILKDDFDKIAQIEEPSEKLEDAKWMWNQLPNRMSPIIFSRLEVSPIAKEKENDINEYTSKIEEIIRKLDVLIENKKETDEANNNDEKAKVDDKRFVTSDDVFAVIAHKTGIPVGKIQSSEQEKLLKIESILKNRVIGQDHAIEILSSSILQSRAGLNKVNSPIGSFFLSGPTGTGKTELAKSLADYLFNDESFLIRFDMSEFKEEHSASLLIGAPPGYVGYEEGGLLVNKIREKPYSVVLFDEIEKAHSSVFDIFLQVLDEGYIHDKQGKRGDFSNAVILFTSNIGVDKIVKEFDEGRIPQSDMLRDVLGEHFRPEFLARLSDLVPFSPIKNENVIKIFNIHLKKLKSRLKDQNIDLKLTKAAEEFLALSEFDPKFGARPLDGVIRNKIRKPLSRMIIEGAVKSGDTVNIDFQENQLKWDIKN